jgi:hypothetical protein
MTKFGKIVFAVLILGGILIFPVAAEEGILYAENELTATENEWPREALQELYLEKLKLGGFFPNIDPDGDIKFQVYGSNYFVIINENDLEFFQIYTGFWLDNMTMEEAYEIVNNANRRSKVAKLSLSIMEDHPDRIVVSITAELLVDKPENFAQIFSRAISLMTNARTIFNAEFAAAIAAN